jgi:hypothetical protein
LALSLVTTMCFAVLFQPALMGRPRNAKTDSDVKEPVPAAEG